MQRFTRLAAAIAVTAPFVMSGCATISADKSAESAALAAAAAQAVAKDAALSPTAQGAGRGASAPGAHASSGVAAAAAAAAAAAQAHKPFAEVIKDAKEAAGLFRVYQKDDKIWIEIAPDQFDHPFFFSWNLSRGLGEKFIYGGLMGDSDIVEFHRMGNTIQLIAKNQVYFASQGKPQARAVAEAFTDSLVAAVPVASQPHPERKSVLIDLNALMLSDIPGANGFLERTYRQMYSFDSRNSS